MRNTRRIKRMSRNRLKITKMNLTSLMDVFTILVFFLLVNSGSVEIVEAPKEMTLPESRIETKPRETVVIFVSPDDVMVQGRPVTTVAEIIEEEDPFVGEVAYELAELAKNIVGINTETIAESREVTILADKSVPFMVVRKIMSTCTVEGYENVSLAVTQKESRVVASN